MNRDHCLKGVEVILSEYKGARRVDKRGMEVDLRKTSRHSEKKPPTQSEKYIRVGKRGMKQDLRKD